MLDHSGHRMKFNRVGHLLQGRIITLVGSSVGLVMYTGTIHMTVTLEPGILVGINWVASECPCVAARCFRYEICAHLENDISSVLAINGDQLEASLNGWNEVRRREVLEDWITICLLIVHPKTKKHVLRSCCTRQLIHQASRPARSGGAAPSSSTTWACTSTSPRWSARKPGWTSPSRTPRPSRWAGMTGVSRPADELPAAVGRPHAPVASALRGPASAWATPSTAAGGLRPGVQRA